MLLERCQTDEHFDQLEMLLGVQLTPEEERARMLERLEANVR